MALFGPTELILEIQVVYTFYIYYPSLCMKILSTYVTAMNELYRVISVFCIECGRV